MTIVPEKLRLDFRHATGLRGPMNTDRVDLIVSLCTQAGMLMEDASLLAVTLRGEAGDAVGAALAQLQTDIATMAALIAAAKALHVVA